MERDNLLTDQQQFRIDVIEATWLETTTEAGYARPERWFPQSQKPDAGRPDIATACLAPANSARSRNADNENPPASAVGAGIPGNLRP